jgi:serine protease Do
VAKESKPKTIQPLFLVLIAIVAGFFGGYYGNQAGPTNTIDSQTVQREIIDSDGNLINKIATEVSPSVVSVNVKSEGVSQDFFGFGQAVEQQSAGTGVVLTSDGIIITNRHVVPSESTEVSVTFADGKEATDVEVIGRTNDSDPLDIAFLKIKDASGLDLQPARLADSDTIQIGDRVVAIGNALGEFQNTVTSGIISGFGRDIEAYDGEGVEPLQNLIQTDAAINSGNSGGPLVNMAGEVVGINVATASADNISFAIPINDIKGLIDTVLATGKLERPYLGIRYVSLNEDIAAELNLDVDQGAFIPRGTSRNPAIIEGSPAEKAGLQERDVIIEIEGQKLDEKNTVISILSGKRVGDSVTIKVNRGGEEVTLQATLEPAPEQ